ncbi:SDR family oxidoreductase [Paenibacillus methanolicus]|uniref:NAD(P)-dependent dehydrogenase (Short-subunit alcohol dehydrogenase family) n=1 Tax=Paenibacillus methanolicus TaxID=582686 RepID=A0A5S5C3W0_9BACL|nr:SDR family oxidoreductase [Paenibacillus methanolicus]TYP74115.1 NAD(P)-dependent dehydrogenase (short-subunit alcohol dehydrogenase family) [Paenibacillus methanolicus]
MNDKIALITGANKGIGLEIARQLGKQGMIVLVGARSLPKAEEAAAKLQAERIQAYPMELDVTNRQHIAYAADRIEKEYGKLDVLVNNAGIYLDHEGTDVDMMRRSFDTNFFGAYALTDSLLHLLKASPEGRIVNQSSILGSVGTILGNDMYGKASAPGYTASKAAMNAWTAQLSIQLGDTPIKVNACHPGWVKTDMGGSGAVMEIHEGAETAVYLATLPGDGPTGGLFHKQEPLPW